MKFRLMNTAGGIDDGGGTTTDDAAAKAAADAAAAKGTPPEFTGPEWMKGWEGLEPEVANDVSLKVFQSPAALAKSYVHAKKELGKKGVMIPSENSPKEEWDQFYQKVGVPLEADKYKESLKFSDKAKLGDEFNSGFLKLAHEARVQPGQANKLYEYFDTQVEATAKKITEAQQTQQQAALDALRDELGPEAYQVKLSKTVDFLKENTSPEFVKFLGESGLGKNATLVKHLMTMADKLGKEGSIPDGDPGYGMTKTDLQREINKSFDPADPYMKPSHPDHKRRVEEIQSYYKKLEK